MSSEFGLREDAVDLAVTDGVEDGNRAAFPAAQFGSEVMTALQMLGNFPLAERTHFQTHY